MSEFDTSPAIIGSAMTGHLVMLSQERVTVFWGISVTGS